MDKLKVPELKAEAKRLGLRRFSRLRKAELIDVINQGHERERERSRNLTPIFDEPVPEINSQILQPTRAVKKNPEESRRRKEANEEEKNRRQEIRDLEEMLGLRRSTQSLSPPKIKISSPEEIEKDKKISKIKEINRKRTRVTETATALSGFARQFRIQREGNYDEIEFMQIVKPDVLRIMRQNRQTRVRLILNCYMTRTDLTNGNIIDAYPYFHSQTIENIEGINESEIIDSMIETIEERFQNFTNRGSNWVLERVLSLDVQMTQYIPLRGRSYIPLPNVLKNKKAIINMKNDDNECFKWCITRALFPVNKHPERIDKNLRENSKRLNWNGLKFPIDLKQITHFEKSNQNISINVFGYEKKAVYPLRLFKGEERQQQINLLLISDDVKKHYCLIKDMSRLLSSQITKHNGSIHICFRCLNAFQTNEKLEIHKEICQSNEFIEMPEEETFIEFENHIRSQKMPFAIYADFESLVEPISGCQPNPEKCFTNQFQKHKPCGFCYHIKCSFDENLSRTVTYRMKNEASEDISQIFVEMIEDDVTRIQNIPKKPLIMQQNDWEDFKNSTKCWICQKEFEEKEKKFRDHCHFTGKFRGAAHNSSNLRYRKPWFTPVIFHNLQNYDAHLFVKNLGKTEGDIRCIPNNEEKYISFTKKIVVGCYIDKEGKEHEIKHDIRFVDSFKFMASSLDALVKNLERDKKIETKKSLLKEKIRERGKTLKEEKLTPKEKEELGEKLDLLSKKGVYPYDFMDNSKKFQETKLPPKEKFYSKLNDENITDEDYQHAQNVWKTFNCKNMGNYHDLYLKTDVLLLCDVFEEFRNVCLENYELDPAWYFTSPGLAWDASLKKTKVKLELLTDIDMLQMIEKGTRGGVSMISNRFGKANNKYMGKDFNPEKPSTFIPYLDANNLYGWAMCEPLPVGEFSWVDEKEFENWQNFPCILEVDLEYSQKLHDIHNDFPLAPDRIVVNGAEKLLSTLNNKEKYVIHHRNLKQYLQMGLKLKKIHRIIKFKEEPWLKSYIELNTKLRANGKNDFEKDFFKLMNNSVFGKTMENIRKRVDIKLVNNRNSALRFAAKPNFESCTIFDENLIAIHMKRVKLLFDKPIYCGMTILDVSKTLIFDFHYDYIKPKYQEKAKLLFTDTDSLCYEIETEDFFKDISNDVHEKFDTSNFEKNHPSNIPTGLNKKVIGMMKDEAGGKIIEEFVGLRAKLYSVKMHEGKEEKKCKGIKKSVIKKTITHQDYKDCLISGKKQMRSLNIIRSHKHEIFTETVNKIALSANDDKRIIREDGIHTFAHGHYKITK